MAPARGGRATPPPRALPRGGPPPAPGRAGGGGGGGARGGGGGRSRGLALLALALLLPLAGCNRGPDASAPATSAPAAPSVTIVTPKKDTVRRTIDQPGRVEAFEETPMYAKIPGYVRKFYVDIGD